MGSEKSLMQASAHGQAMLRNVGWSQSGGSINPLPDERVRADLRTENIETLGHGSLDRIRMDIRAPARSCRRGAWSPGQGDGR